MHSAPAVTYPVGRCHIQGWLTLVPWGLGAAACALWILDAGRIGWPQGLALLLWLLTGMLALRSLLAAPTGMLHWDGRQWTWQTQGGSWCGTAHQLLDFQRWVLLEFRVFDGRPQWLWLSHAAAPAHWAALRRAVCSRASRLAADPADGLVDGMTAHGRRRT